MSDNIFRFTVYGMKDRKTLEYAITNSSSAIIEIAKMAWKSKHFDRVWATKRVSADIVEPLWDSENFI